MLFFFRKELNPGPKTLVTKDDFEKFTNNDDTQVVGFFGAFPSDLKEAYRLSVDRLGQSVLFGIVDDEDLMNFYRKFENRIVLFRLIF